LVTIIDVGISNIKSITRGFVTQGFQVQVTTDPEEVQGAGTLVLPGVGAYPKAMEALRGYGLIEPIRMHAEKGKPLIGICLGMQLLFSDSNEHGHTEGLGLIPGHVVQFPKDRPVPHMGWNEVSHRVESPIFEGIPDPADFYFVHSYYAVPDRSGQVIGESDHHGCFAAAVQNGRVFGTQFHPEKSQKNGLTLLRNFANIV
jgi:glutamine amidotransferase